MRLEQRYGPGEKGSRHPENQPVVPSHAAGFPGLLRHDSLKLPYMKLTRRSLYSRASGDDSASSAGMLRRLPQRGQPIEASVKPAAASAQTPTEDSPSLRTAIGPKRSRRRPWSDAVYLPIESEH